MIVKYSTLDHQFDKHPKPASIDWFDLLDALSIHEFREQKNGPLYSPCEFADTPDSDGKYKTKENARVVHFGVLDFDDITLDQWEAACARAAGFDAIMYTTWQNPQAREKGRIRSRLVVPFSRPCSADEWPAIWPRLVDFFGGSAAGVAVDTSCSDCNRFYFGPSLPVGADWAAQVWKFGPGPGDDREPASWDIEAALRSPLPLTVRAPLAEAAGLPGPLLATPSDPVSEASVRKLAKKLRRKENPWQQRMGNLIDSGLDGAILAGHGDRDTTIFQVAGALAKEFPFGNPFDIADKFRLSIELMRQDGSTLSVEEMAEKIRRCQSKVRVERDAELGDGETKIAEDRASLILRAFDGRRTAQYSAEEIDAWEIRDAAPMARRWLLQYQNKLWLMLDGKYVGPFAVERSVYAPAVAQYLAAAPIKVSEIDDFGASSVRSIEELMRDYGTVLHEIVYDLAAQCSYLREGILYEAPCPRAKLVPLFDDLVAEWLDLLGGEKKDRLLMWLTAATMLELPSPALVLIGPAGSGKTALASCLARLYDESSVPTSLEVALSPYAAPLVRQPIILGDESVPKDFRGRARYDELKELVSAVTRSVAQKYVPTLRAKGAVRVILTANNFEGWRTSDDLNEDDIAALRQRFLFVRPTDEAVQFFERHAGEWSLADWRDRVASHVLWLRENCQEFLRPGRFLVEGDCEDLENALRIGSGAAWPALYWIHSFVTDPSRHIARCAGRSMAGQIRDGAVWIDQRLMLERWADYCGDEKAPTMRALVKASRGLLGEHLSYRDGERWGKMRRVSPALVVAWCQAQDLDPREFLDALQVELSPRTLKDPRALAN